MSENELGAFLRSRREALRPCDVGLPSGTRRRTPGLRRAELATLAGVSAEYLARLEQGRDRHPSRQVLAALVDALRLTDNDQHQLRRLVKAARGIQFPSIEPPGSEVRPTVRMLLDRLEPAPAAVINRLTDVLAYTDGFTRLMAPIGLLDRTPANLVRFVLMDPRAHTAYLNWAEVADARTAALRVSPHLTDPHVNALAEELTALAGTAFTSRAHTDSPARTGIEELRHPDAGDLRLAFEMLTLPDGDDQQLIVYLPADESTSARLDRLLRTGPSALPPTTEDVDSASNPGRSADRHTNSG
ncbi:transcriptional regulator with XRE-family HTH domain [Nocardia transvalensis]|uniref:Transcriptional regulator with XRE-family HTH domain n=1 Tax=Nocardia transvalensis TaxID=37333 RepID=A0A7W9PGN6_9NOCA|nr:helix-turn-helix transcriptional regulator [Nocardia transvalensis]MBB5915681.1 transcriptional regulator with XRE-family HTH domain [Nocardia transvalensis]